MLTYGALALAPDWDDEEVASDDTNFEQENCVNAFSLTDRPRLRVLDGGLPDCTKEKHDDLQETASAKRLDAESGLLAATHRYYQPTTGTFLTVDPLVAATRAPYQYALGDPVSLTDRSGLTSCAGGGDAGGVSMSSVEAPTIDVSVCPPPPPLNLGGDVNIEPPPQVGDIIPVQNDALGIQSWSGSTVIAPPTDTCYASEATSGDGQLDVPNDVLGQIDNTGAAPPGVKGGGDFENDGRGGGQVLPQTDGDGNPIKYQEWDVNPPGPGGRDAERIVTGSDGSAWYTDDHYSTFTRLR